MAEHSSVSKPRLTKRLVIVGLSFVFVLSVIWHLPIAPLLNSATGLLSSDSQSVVFSNADGKLWDGATQIQWQEPSSNTLVDLGEVRWQQSPMGLISQLNPALEWQTQFGHWNGYIEKGWLTESLKLSTEDLQLDLEKLVYWMSAFVKFPLLLEGQLRSQTLNFTWMPESLFQTVDATFQIEKLNAMGLVFPSIKVQLAMQDSDKQVLRWTMNSQDLGWKMHGQGTLNLNPSSKEFAIYQGEILVDAESQDRLPDFATLLPNVNKNQAQWQFSGNLQRFLAQ